jgi:hypothetical protein
MKTEMQKTERRELTDAELDAVVGGSLAQICYATSGTLAGIWNALTYEEPGPWELTTRHTGVLMR